MSLNCGCVTDGAEQLHVVLILHYSVSHFIASALMSKEIALSVKDKVAVVSALNDGTKNASICKQFGLSQSTVSIMWKN
ncbi:hypothetical protein T11_418 [Trichinella zimbabwensis]|uniref:HTH psq-type domain-containing protein n=1 Tax=Trichinella zimbabwensis TaxID=268475 RepID=A0A0V1GVI4_9BILA|nr:hypothetical protein T11_418 [Trichinella zimbabwensis]